MKMATWLNKTALILCSSLVLGGTALGDIAIRTVSSPASNLTPSSTPEADSANMRLSRSGDWGIFESTGSGLTEDLTDNGVNHLYRRDFLTHQTRLLTLSSSDLQLANGNSFALAISGNDRYLLVLSDATNLVPQTVSGQNNLFRLDLETGEWKLVAHDLGVESSSGGIEKAEISTDGSRILFSSQNSAIGNIPPGNTAATIINYSLYLADLESGQLTLESTYPLNGVLKYDSIGDFSLAPDAKHAIYVSLNPGSPNTTKMIIRDLLTHTSDRPQSVGIGIRDNVELFTISENGLYYFFGKNIPAPSGKYMDVLRGEFTSSPTNALAGRTDIAVNTSVPFVSTPDGSRLFFATTKGLEYWDAKTNSPVVPIFPAPTNSIVSVDWLYGVSTDGNKILYGESLGTNLSPYHLYLGDVPSGQTRQITSDPVLPGETFGNADMDPLAKRIVFDTIQRGYVPADENQRYDIFSFDPASGDITLQSPKVPGSMEPGHTGFSKLNLQAISENGDYCIFATGEPSILQPFATREWSLLRQNLQTGARDLLTVDINGSPLKDSTIGGAVDWALSKNGKFTLILTYSTNMTERKMTNLQPQLVLRDIVNKTNHLVTVDDQLINNSVPKNKLLSYSMSDDGRWVVYNTALKNWPKIYDTLNDTALPAVRDADGNDQTVSAYSTVISPDGKTLAFASSLTNLTTGLEFGPDFQVRLYLKSVPTGTNQWLQSATEGLPPNRGFTSTKLALSFSADSTLLISSFELSTSSNQTRIVDLQTGALIANLYNAQSVVVSDDRKYAAYLGFADRQVYVTYLPTGETRLVTHAYGLPNTPVVGASSAPTLSRDGVWLAFKSRGSNLVSEISSIFGQAYLYNLQTDQTILLSHSTNTNSPANGPVGNAMISPSQSVALFSSGATDLMANGETSGFIDIFQAQAPPTTSTQRDSDSDGLPDWWENRYFGTLTKNASDTAPSGLTLKAEYQQAFGPPLGTTLEIALKNAAGLLQISFPTIVGKRYRLETTFDLQTPSWFSTFPPTPENFIAAETNSTISLQISPLLLNGHDAVYYRVAQDD